MDPHQIADMANALAPYMPLLQGQAEAVISGTVDALKEATARWAKRGWEILLGHASETGPQERAALEVTGSDLALNPTDADAIGALRNRMRVLSSRPDVERDLIDWWREGVERGYATIATERGVAIAGDASNNIIITGDNNETSTGKDL